MASRTAPEQRTRPSVQQQALRHGNAAALSTLPTHQCLAPAVPHTESRQAIVDAHMKAASNLLGSSKQARALPSNDAVSSHIVAAGMPQHSAQGPSAGADMSRPAVCVPAIRSQPAHGCSQHAAHTINVTHAQSGWQVQRKHNGDTAGCHAGIMPISSRSAAAFTGMQHIAAASTTVSHPPPMQRATVVQQDKPSAATAAVPRCGHELHHKQAREEQPSDTALRRAADADATNGNAPASLPQQPPPAPAWLLPDLIEIAQNSHVSSGPVCNASMARQKVAICCADEVSATVIGKDREHMLQPGIYEGRVLEVRPRQKTP